MALSAFYYGQSLDLLMGFLSNSHERKENQTLTLRTNSKTPMKASPTFTDKYLIIKRITSKPGTF